MMGTMLDVSLWNTLLWEFAKMKKKGKGKGGGKKKC
jgi:hypothetical protein